MERICRQEYFVLERGVSEEKDDRLEALLQACLEKSLETVVLLLTHTTFKDEGLSVLFRKKTELSSRHRSEKTFVWRQGIYVPGPPASNLERLHCGIYHARERGFSPVMTLKFVGPSVYSACHSPLVLRKEKTRFQSSVNQESVSERLCLLDPD